MSRALGAEDNAHHDLQQTLRLLQLEDEDVAMAVALAASLKVGCCESSAESLCLPAVQMLVIASGIW